MNMEKKPMQYEDLQVSRDEYIKQIDSANDKTSFVFQNSESLYALGLTMYSKNYSFESLVYSAFSSSVLDENISLHPEQLKVLDIMQENKGTIFSAPTSFGKTFVVFEYIAKYKPQNVVLVVPTLALIDEYKQKIIKKYRNSFIEYNVYLSIDEEKTYDFEKRKNIFIVTHDRVVNENIVALFKKIDLLVIDEVYKLQKDENNDRVLILNIAYYNMVKISNKYILLAPFISGVENLDKLDDIPVFYNTNFSPVVNEVRICEVLDESDRNTYVTKILNSIPSAENTLIYFPTVKGIDNYIQSINKKSKSVVEINEILADFVEWAKREVHEEWAVIKAIENGYLVHHGQLPLGIRLLQLDLFNNDNRYNRLICTSTLLEGVNTTAKHIIITKPARGYKNGQFDAFDFYNLVGRTGRLYQHYLGIAHYIKAPNDPIYNKDQALKKIQFELTDDSLDIGINCGDYRKYPDFIEFLNKLKIDYETYKREIGVKCRFSTILFLYDNYLKFKQELVDELHILLTNDARSKLSLIRVLYRIINGKNVYKYKLDTFIINKLTYLTRESIHRVVDDTHYYYTHETINDIISKSIRFKSSYIEHDFYNKISIIKFFMKCDKIDINYTNLLHERLTKNIEILYYINSSSRKMLKDMGIYDRDIKVIIGIIGDRFETISELQELIKKNITRLNKISIVSKYVIKNLIS